MEAGQQHCGTLKHKRDLCALRGTPANAPQRLSILPVTLCAPRAALPAPGRRCAAVEAGDGRGDAGGRGGRAAPGRAARAARVCHAAGCSGCQQVATEVFLHLRLLVALGLFSNSSREKPQVCFLRLAGRILAKWALDHGCCCFHSCVLRVHHTIFVLLRRPGDTIELEAAQVHEAADIAVRWPLRLRGNGAAPEDTVLVCPRGADAALVFRCGGLHGTSSASQLF